MGSCCSFPGSRENPLAVNYLLGLNGAFLFLSVIIIGFGLYRVIVCAALPDFDTHCGLNRAYDSELIAQYGDTLTVVLFVSGALLLLVAICGGIAVAKHNKGMLCLYALLVALMAALLGASSILLLTFAGVIPNYNIERAILDLQGSIFNSCCFEAGYVNETVVICKEVVTELCIENLYEVDPGFCSFLEELPVKKEESTTVPLVSNTDEGGCGGEDGFSGFIELIAAAVYSDAAIGIAIIDIFSTVLLLLALVACLVLLCSQHNRHPPHKKVSFAKGTDLTGGVPIYQPAPMVPRVTGTGGVPHI